MCTEDCWQIIKQGRRFRHKDFPIYNNDLGRFARLGRRYVASVYGKGSAPALRFEELLQSAFVFIEERGQVFKPFAPGQVPAFNDPALKSLLDLLVEAARDAKAQIDRPALPAEQPATKAPPPRAAVPAPHPEPEDLLKKPDGKWKDAVSFGTAEKYLSIGERQRRKLVNTGDLKVVGKGHFKKITVHSLLNYAGRAPQPGSRPNLTLMKNRN